MAILIIQKIIMMLIIVLIGIFCVRRRIIDGELTVKLSNFLLLIVNPIVIFVSYQNDYDRTILKNLFFTLLLATGGLIIHILVVGFLISKKRVDYDVERLSAIYGNAGFIGIPLVSALYGKEGVFYITAYLTVFYIFFWSHGVIMMSGKANWKETAKNLLSPAIIGVLLGLLCFLCQIRLPSVIVEALDSVGGMNTPLAMIVAGATLGQSRILECLKHRTIYYVSFLKLLLIPVLLMLLMVLMRVPQTILVTLVIASGCPAGTCCTMFALRYKGDGTYASQIFAVTTMLAAVTIPMLIYLSDILIAVS